MTTITTGIGSIEQPEERLLAAARAGDPEAFCVLVDRYRGVVFAYALARTRNREEAEDIAQDTFLRAYAGLNRMRTLSAWEAWLMRILRNRCTDVLRRKRVRKNEPLETATLPGLPSAESLALARADQRELTLAIDELPEKYRVPLLMHYVSRLTYREISLAEGLPITTVRGRLAGALLLLRRRLGEEGQP